MSGGIKHSNEILNDIKDYTDLGMKAKEISNAVHISLSSAYKWKTYFERHKKREEAEMSLKLDVENYEMAKKEEISKMFSDVYEQGRKDAIEQCRKDAISEQKPVEKKQKNSDLMNLLKAFYNADEVHPSVTFEKYHGLDSIVVYAWKPLFDEDKLMSTGKNVCMCYYFSIDGTLIWSCIHNQENK